MKLVDLLKKAPQSVIDKYNIEVREKAIEGVKARIIKHNKTLDDYSDDEMESMIKEEENKINDSVKTKILITLLAAAGIKGAFFT